MYMRGEKPEIANAVVAWASQTGNGLLFFNKKGDTSRKQPEHVLALYDATDLKKESPHEVAFKLNGQEHTLKATSDSERDGWYMSLENAIETGKAAKEEVRSSEGYKAEMEKLSTSHNLLCHVTRLLTQPSDKPNTAAGGVAAVASKRGQSQPKKSMDADKTDAHQRTNSDSDDQDDKKKQKSRSTSRGILNRFKGNKDESDAKKEESKPEESKAEEAAPAIAGGAVAGVAGAGAAEEAKSCRPFAFHCHEETIANSQYS